MPKMSEQLKFDLYAANQQLAAAELKAEMAKVELQTAREEFDKLCTQLDLDGSLWMRSFYLRKEFKLLARGHYESKKSPSS